MTEPVWTPAFEGQRPPFEPGNELAVKHGGYMSPLRLAGRVEEIAETLRQAMPLEPDRFEAALEAAAFAGARLERLAAALEKADEAAEQRLQREAGRWWSRWITGLRELGLTPSSAAKLGLNVTLAMSASETALQQHLRANYSAGVVDADAVEVELPGRAADKLSPPDADEDVDILLKELGEQRVEEACGRLGWLDDEEAD